MSEANKPEELLVGSIIIKGNTLVYENQAIQINTLTAIWIDDLTVNVKNPFPRWIKTVAMAAGLAVLLGLLSQEPILMAIGIVLASLSIARYTKYVPNTKKPRFALGIEKASGECIIFPSNNKDAVDKAANALFEAISSKENLFETFIFNISKKVPVKKSVGSKIFLKKKPRPGPKLHAKKPTEKLVENIETLKPPPPPPPPQPATPAPAPASEAPATQTPPAQTPAAQTPPAPKSPAENAAQKAPEGAGA